MIIISDTSAAASFLARRQTAPAWAVLDTPPAMVCFSCLDKGPVEKTMEKKRGNGRSPNFHSSPLPHMGTLGLTPSFQQRVTFPSGRFFTRTTGPRGRRCCGAHTGFRLRT